MKLKHLVENEVLNITDPEEAYEYAQQRGKRIPELEPIILKNSSCIVMYAHDVIKGRWPEAEPTIMENPGSAYKYAKDVIKGRWPEAEPVIMKNTIWANHYLRDFPEVRTPSKDVPLILNLYVITDVPNTITDEQVEQLLKIIEPGVITLHRVKDNRTYFEPLIKKKLADIDLKRITTKQLLQDEQLRHTFLKHIGCYVRDHIITDFN